MPEIRGRELEVTGDGRIHTHAASLEGFPAERTVGANHSRSLKQLICTLINLKRSLAKGSSTWLGCKWFVNRIREGVSRTPQNVRWGSRFPRASCWGSGYISKEFRLKIVEVVSGISKPISKINCISCEPRWTIIISDDFQKHDETAESLTSRSPVTLPSLYQTFLPLRKQTLYLK